MVTVNSLKDFSLLKRSLLTLQDIELKKAVSFFKDTK